MVGFETSTDRWIMIAVAMGFLFTAFLSTLEKALAVAVSIGVFLSVIQEKWNMRKDASMWSIMIILAASQISLIFIFRIPNVPVGAIAIPFAIAEGLALWGVLNWIDGRSPPSTKL